MDGGQTQPQKRRNCLLGRDCGLQIRCGRCFLEVNICLVLTAIGIISVVSWLTIRLEAGDSFTFWEHDSRSWAFPTFFSVFMLVIIISTFMRFRVLRDSFQTAALNNRGKSRKLQERTTDELVNINRQNEAMRRPLRQEAERLKNGNDAASKYLKDLQSIEDELAIASVSCVECSGRIRSLVDHHRLGSQRSLEVDEDVQRSLKTLETSSETHSRFVDDLTKLHGADSCLQPVQERLKALEKLKCEEDLIKQKELGIEAAQRGPLDEKPTC